MATADQSGDSLRDFSSPATWGDVERVRLTLETRMANLEARLVRSLFVAVGAGVTILGVLIGILEATR